MNNLFDFIGSKEGPWKVKSIISVLGDPLEKVSYIKIIPGLALKPNEGQWTLRGVASNLRYTEKAEEDNLAAIQEGLGRSEATCAALIPIRKSKDWWSLAQDERRKIFETKSNHIQTGLQYLPAIARKLYHCRDLNEPFDFLTWFEYTPSNSDAFETLVASLRKTEEWKYVDREIDIRLQRQMEQY